jgi:thiol-disulfide isomerase/thioredoxin
MNWKYYCTCFNNLYQSLKLQAQSPIDNRPNYIKNPALPAFKLILTDSSLFTEKLIPKAEYTCIVYFSPDCGHCQYEADQMIRKMDSLKQVQFIWISYREFNDIKSIWHGSTNSIYIQISSLGRDPEYIVPAFYQVKFTPFVALYDQNKQFLKAWESGVEMPELLQFIHKK